MPDDPLSETSLISHVRNRFEPSIIDKIPFTFSLHIYIFFSFLFFVVDALPFLISNGEDNGRLFVYSTCHFSSTELGNDSHFGSNVTRSRDVRKPELFRYFVDRLLGALL